MLSCVSAPLAAKENLGESSHATMPSMRNEIWAAPFGDAGVDSTAEAASKRRAYENSWPIDDGEGL